MNTMKNVMAKVAIIETERVELASERIELGLAQDMAGYATRIAKASGTLGDMEKNINALKAEYNGLIGEAGKRASTILRLQKATEDAYNFNKKQYASVAKNAMTSEYKKLATAMAGNGFKALENIDNKNYFFNATDASKSKLLALLAKIK
jgi:hypothetical protein